MGSLLAELVQVWPKLLKIHLSVVTTHGADDVVSLTDVTEDPLGASLPYGHVARLDVDQSVSIKTNDRTNHSTKGVLGVVADAKVHRVGLHGR